MGNFNIALGVRPVPQTNALADAVGIAQALEGIQSMRQRRQYQDRQIQAQDLALQKQNAVRGILQQGLSPEETQSALMREVPEAAMEYGKYLSTLKKDQLEQHKTELENAEKQSQLIAREMSLVRSPEEYASAWSNLIKNGVKIEAGKIPAYSPEVVKGYADRALSVADQRRFQLDQINNLNKQRELYLKEADAKRGPAEMQTFREVFYPGWLEKSGKPKNAASEFEAFREFKQPQRAAVPGVDTPLSPEVEAQKTRIAKAQAAARRAVDIAGLSGAQNQRINQIAGQFDNEPIVKNYNVITEAKNFVDGLGTGKQGNAGDDQALLYSFAKVMDPGSVVREGEYATVQKYAQSWADNFGFKVSRIASNSPFLTDEARKQMKATINKRADSAKNTYKNLHSEYARRIERQAGVKGGTDFLTDYGKAFSETPGQGASDLSGKSNEELLKMLGQ